MARRNGRKPVLQFFSASVGCSFGIRLTEKRRAEKLKGKQTGDGGQALQRVALTGRRERSARLKAAITEKLKH
jgi:hypothetical protein